jgi:Periplasmic component of the Tol biopolymer transport system
MFKKLLQSLTKKSLTSKIIFQNCGDSVPGISIGILTVNPDGTELVRIRSLGSAPEWSPDGKWIAFSGLVEGYKPYACNIHIMKPDGTGVRQITRHTTGGASSPAWSSDSRTIAYYVFEDGVEHQIWTVDVNSGKQRQLAKDGISPVWTSANEIVFEKNEGNHPLLIMNSNGEQLRECGLFNAGDWSIRWSRDGDKIAFLRNRDIYVMDSNGSNLQPIREGAQATWLSWSPDGQQLAYCGDRYEQGRPTGKEIYIIDSNGINERKIVANPSLKNKLAECINVCWSPWLH